MPALLRRPAATPRGNAAMSPIHPVSPARAPFRGALRAWGAAFAGVLLAGAGVVQAASLPERDLVLEIQEVQEGSSGYVVGTEPQAPLMPARRVQVRNGEAARLQFMQAVPIEWTAAAQQGYSRSAGGGTGGASGGGAPSGGNTTAGGAAVQQRLIWLQAGQSMVFQPQWPGGQRPARVSVRVQTARVEPSSDGRLPTQQGSDVQTVVDAPLGEWVTLARTGTPSTPGTYRSDARDQRPRLLQLRVTLP